MEILFLFIGIILGGLIVFFTNKKVSEKTNKSSGTRRGLIKKPYTITSNGIKHNFDVSFEIIELERSNLRSKVKVIEMIPSSRISSNDMDGVKTLMDNSWELTSHIDWIENLEDTRNKK
jgi:hypothetical protein